MQNSDDDGDRRLLVLALLLVLGMHEFAAAAHQVDHIDHLPHVEQTLDLSGLPPVNWRV